MLKNLPEFYFVTTGIVQCISNSYSSTWYWSYSKLTIKFTPEQATKVQRGSRGIALLFLQPRC